MTTLNGWPKPTKVRHGTASGFRLHQELDERPCDPCLEAKSDYDKRRKTADPERQRSRLHAAAQAKTHTRLRALHLDEYRTIYQEELAKLKEQL